MRITLNTRRYFAAGFLAAALTFSASVGWLWAKTVVAPTAGEKCSFTVTVQIAYAFLDAGSQAKADDLIKLWKEAMEKMWNGPSKSQTTGDCKCKVKFVFDIIKLDKGKDCRQAPGDYHCFNVVDQPANQRGNVADSQVIPPQGKFNGYGEWTVGASGNDAAHEVGHLLGLSDEYKYDDTDGDGQKDDYVNVNPQKNPDGSMKPVQSIMAQTWGSAAPTQEQIDKIMKDAGQSCPAECCCGNGAVDNNKTVKEACDPKANPNGCPSDQQCTDQCQCVGGLVVPECGDGEIAGEEECDDAKQPNGCPEGEFCLECVCYTLEPKLPPPPASAPPVVPEPVPEPEPEPEPEPVACHANADCEDGDPCTYNLCMFPGTAKAYCTKTWVTGCGGQDGCCPSNCSAVNDVDCPAKCGDQSCSPNESCQSCPVDCGTCPPVCGDGVCAPGEDCTACPGDCGGCGLPQCADLEDNDGDLLIDLADPGCEHPLDPTE